MEMNKNDLENVKSLLIERLKALGINYISSLYDPYAAAVLSHQETAAGEKYKYKIDFMFLGTDGIGNNQIYRCQCIAECNRTAEDRARQIGDEYSELRNYLQHISDVEVMNLLTGVKEAIDPESTVSVHPINDIVYAGFAVTEDEDEESEELGFDILYRQNDPDPFFGSRMIYLRLKNKNGDWVTDKIENVLGFVEADDGLYVHLNQDEFQTCETPFIHIGADSKETTEIKKCATEIGSYWEHYEVVYEEDLDDDDDLIKSGFLIYEVFKECHPVKKEYRLVFDQSRCVADQLCASNNLVLPSNCDIEEIFPLSSILSSNQWGFVVEKKPGLDVSRHESDMFWYRFKQQEAEGKADSIYFIMYEDKSWATLFVPPLPQGRNESRDQSRHAVFVKTSLPGKSVSDDSAQ